MENPYLELAGSFRTLVAQMGVETSPLQSFLLLEAVFSQEEHLVKAC